MKTLAGLLPQLILLGILSDMIAYALYLAIPIKQLLRGEANVTTRFQTRAVRLQPLVDGDTTVAIDTPRPTNANNSRKTSPPPFRDNRSAYTHFDYFIVGRPTT